MVVTLDGRIFGGAIGRGIDITPNGLEPNLGSLTPLDYYPGKEVPHAAAY